MATMTQKLSAVPGGPKRTENDLTLPGRDNKQTRRPANDNSDGSDQGRDGASSHTQNQLKVTQGTE